MKNLKVSYDRVRNGNNFGGICVNDTSSVIENCHVSGDLVVGCSSGGIAGTSYGNCYIIDTSFEGSIKCTGSENPPNGVGGFVGVVADYLVAP